MLIELLHKFELSPKDIGALEKLLIIQTEMEADEEGGLGSPRTFPMEWAGVKTIQGPTE